MGRKNVRSSEPLWMLLLAISFARGVSEGLHLLPMKDPAGRGGSKGSLCMRGIAHVLAFRNA